MKYLILDYETRSRCDLKRSGGYEYSVHPSTSILCVAWRYAENKAGLRDASTHSWALTDARAPEQLVMGLLDDEVRLVAHNAYFEQVITKNVLSRLIKEPKLAKLPPSRWQCTAAQAAALALPRHLEGACKALKLPFQKDMEGHKLMMKMCKPRRVSKNNPSEWHNRKSDLDRLMRYCVADIEAEVALFLAIPELSPAEREVWLLDQKINLRGMRVDRPMVKQALELIADETKQLTEETHRITEGRVRSVTQRQAVLDFVRDEGYPLVDLTAKTVQDSLKAGGVPAISKRLLEIRQSVGKTSTAKYEAFFNRSHFDGRVRDHLLYHGASTGRWAGMGLQPQNFPRGTISDVDVAVDAINSGNLSYIRCIYSNPMAVFSSCLRSAIIASSDKEFFCADFAAIETRVLFWLCDHAKGLKSLVTDCDLYHEMAEEIFSRKVPAKGVERELGKRAILGCGYGMGKVKFHATCETYNQPVSEELAERAVTAYRRLHAPVVSFWYDIERAALHAVSNPGKRFRFRKTVWSATNNFLWCMLPSGRKLAFYRPEIRYVMTKWGEKKKTLYHWFQDPKTRQWMCGGTYGGKLVENITQAVARDFMVASMLRHEEAGYEVTLTVHDEELAERKKGEGSLEEFLQLMTKLPEWGKGCPIKAEGWRDERYRK